jgi:DNA polymerase II small subunit
MSQKSVTTVKSIVAAGYQLDKDCLELLRLIEDRVDLDRLAVEVVNEASKAKLWPPVVDRPFLEKVALRISPKEGLGLDVIQPSGVAATIPYAKEVPSEIEIPDGQRPDVRSKASMDDFTRYFRTRFKKIRDILNERIDVRGAGTIGEALEASLNQKVRFVAMIMDKRPRKDHLFLSVDDEEDNAVVMVQRSKADAFEMAQSAPLDQVVYIEASRGKGDLFVCEKLYLPDIPDHQPHRAEEPVSVALLSDIHVGSRTFLREEFTKMILWLNGKIGTPNQRDLAGSIKYVVIAGDLVDGVGIYPDQDRELDIPDVYAQYKVAAQFIEQIPDYMDVIFIPGNHDATRQAVPQPAVDKEFAEPVYQARSVYALDNPSRVLLHGVHFLLYHGRSLDDVVATVPGMTFQTPDKAMEHLLRCRHLAPEYGKRTPIAPEQEDCLVIRDVPDVFHAGHVHVLKHKEYRRTVIVNSGAWQTQTEYQRKMGLVPTPGILPTISLQTLQVGLIDFTSA